MAGIQLTFAAFQVPRGILIEFSKEKEHGGFYVFVYLIGIDWVLF